jgi:hypothetical protein
MTLITMGKCSSPKAKTQDHDIRLFVRAGAIQETSAFLSGEETRRVAGLGVRRPEELA